MAPLKQPSLLTLPYDTHIEILRAPDSNKQTCMFQLCLPFDPSPFLPLDLSNLLIFSGPKSNGSKSHTFSALPAKLFHTRAHREHDSICMAYYSTRTKLLLARNNWQGDVAVSGPSNLPWCHGQSELPETSKAPDTNICSCICHTCTQRLPYCLSLLPHQDLWKERDALLFIFIFPAISTGRAWHLLSPQKQVQNWTESWKFFFF